jgi:PAS domain S-box-containing protein
LAAPELQRVLDALPDAVVAADGSHTIVYANAAVERLLGWSPGELVGRPLTKLIPARMQGPHREGFKRFMATGRSHLEGHALRVPACHRDGTEVDVEMHLNGRPDPQHGGLVVATLRDSRPTRELERQRDLAQCLRATAEAAAHLGFRNDPVAWAQSVVDALVSDFDAALARLWLLDPDEGTLVLRAAAGPARTADDPPAGGSTIRLSWSPAKYDELIRRRTPFVKNGLEGDPDFDARWVAREGIAAVAAFPLCCAGELLGALVSFTRHPLPPEFTAALGAFAAIVAAALSDIQMFERARAAQVEAETQRRKLQTILDVLPVGVLLLEGPEGRLSLINPAGEQMATRTPVADTLGEFQDAVDLRHLDGTPYAPEERPLYRTLTHGERVNETLIYRRSDGVDLVLEVATAPFPGPIGGAVSTFRDVTEERRLRGELAERAAQLKALLDHLPVGVAYFDPGGTCRAANGPARKTLGRTRGAITGVPAAELFERTPALREALVRCLESQTPHVEPSVPWFDLMATTTQRFLEWRFEPLPPATGKAAGALALIVDITDRKLAADGLRRAAEAAQQASRNKTQFLSAVSHDLRTPVNALSLQAEWLAHVAARQRDADPELAPLAADIRRAAGNLIELVNDLLELTLFDSGAVEYHPSEFRLDEWLETTLAPLRLTATARGLEFTWAVDRPGRVVHGDRVKMGRVLVNLAGNAVKFTERGSVRVAARAGEGGGLELAVTDTGPGIPADGLGRIFDEFAQLRNPERDRTKGSGLGLAICRRLVEVAGGTLTVESAPGRGSTFTAQYPADHLPRDAHMDVTDEGPSDASSLVTAATGPILLVEDDPYSRRSLAKLLERKGYVVRSAETGPEAVALVDEAAPGLVLLDLMLPGMDGSEVLRHIRRRYTREQLPVIVLSGDVLSGRSTELQALDANGLLSKPVELDELMAVVKRWAGPAAGDRDAAP